MPHNQVPHTTDAVRLALLERDRDDHRDDIKNLNVAVKELTSEIVKAREAMIRKFSFMAGIATAFGAIGGLIGTGLAIAVEYFSKKG